MRQAKTFKDLPLGTPVLIYSLYDTRITYKGLVYEHIIDPDLDLWRDEYIVIMLSCGDKICYYENELINEEIFIMEAM